MAKDDNSDWILQASIKTRDEGTLINVRGKNAMQFKEALDALSEHFDNVLGLAKMLCPAVTAPPAAPTTGTRTNDAVVAPSGPRPVPTAPGPNPGATQVGDFFVKKILPAKVFAKKNTGRSNERGPIYAPGTIVDQDGTKYDTFDETLLALGTSAKAAGQWMNVAYKLEPKYGKFRIIDKGLTLHGVVEAPEEDNRDAADGL